MKPNKLAHASVSLIVAALVVGACTPATTTPPTESTAAPASGVSTTVEGPLPCSVNLSVGETVNYRVPKANRQYKIALLQVSLQGYYYVGIAYGAYKAAEEAGVDLTMVAASGYASPEQQLQQMEDILQGEVDAVVMAPSDIYGSVPAVQKAVEKGLPVINISTEVASPDVVQVMQDDYLMGRLAADRVAELFGSQNAKGVIIAGPDRATWSRKRTQGFLDRVKEAHPTIEVVAVRNQLVDPAEGLKSFEDATQANPDIDWVYSVHSYILPAQSLAPQYQGRIKYVTNGLEPDSLTALQNGWIDSIFGIVPVPMGYVGVGKAVEILNGTKQPPFICVPPPLFTKDNVEQMPTQTDMFPAGWEPPR